VSVAPVTNGLGSELREARVQLGLTLEQVAYETRIRTRYLEALEDERWDDLPGEAYAKGFLRTYAGFVGLDGAQMLARYRTRFPRRGDPPVAPRPQPPYEPRRAVGAIAAVAALVLVVGAVLVAWRLDASGDGEQASRSASQPTAKPQPRPAARPKPAAKPAPARPAVLALTTLADCWLEVRVGGSGGKVAWVGTLRPGRRLRLGLRKPLWFQAGNPDALRATIGGKARPLPAGAGSVVATRAGLRAA
jgi:cytoskeletal protein RodZ